MQALLQGPRQTFKLPVSEFKQAVRDAESSVNYPGKSSTGLKVRLPIGKVGLAGQGGKKSKSAPRNRSASVSRCDHAVSAALTLCWLEQCCRP